MEELIEKLRVKYKEQEQIIESQKAEVSSSLNLVSRVTTENAQLKGEIMELRSKLKNFKKAIEAVK